MGPQSHKKYTDRNFKPPLPTSRVEVFWWKITAPRIVQCLAGISFAMYYYFGSWKQSVLEIGKREFMRSDEEKLDDSILAAESGNRE